MKRLAKTEFLILAIFSVGCMALAPREIAWVYLSFAFLFTSLSVLL